MSVIPCWFHSRYPSIDVGLCTCRWVETCRDDRVTANAATTASSEPDTPNGEDSTCAATATKRR